MKKIAIVLFNLGGPDQPSAVRPFLYNLFSDPAIIGLSTPWRQILAVFIAWRRNKVAQAIYAKIGGKSPILENTQAQAKALEKTLKGNADKETRCFVSMRYWHPLDGEAVKQVKAFAPDEIVLLPLYPQFSTTTTASSLKSWHQSAEAVGLQVPTKTICCYPQESGFIQTMALSVSVVYQQLQHKAGKPPRVLFSAHGLPEKIIKAGDPYQWQCERTAEALVQALNIAQLDWVSCYQSRVGPLSWIGPSTTQEIRRAARDQVSLVIVPIAFVSEHSETLVEIDIEYRHMAAQCGVPNFAYVPTVGTTPAFIEGLADLVHKALDGREACISTLGPSFCSPTLKGCCQRRDI